MSGIMNTTGAVSGILGTTVGTPESDNASALTTGTLPTARLPAGSVIQAKHFHYDGGLTIGTTSHSIPFTGTVDTGSPSLDFGCPITKSASSDIYISGIITHGFPDEDQWTRFRGFHSEDAGSNWVDFLFWIVSLSLITNLCNNFLKNEYGLLYPPGPLTHNPKNLILKKNMGK